MKFCFCVQQAQGQTILTVDLPGVLEPVSCVDVGDTGRFSCAAGQAWRCVEYVITHSSQAAASSALSGTERRLPGRAARLVDSTTAPAGHVRVVAACQLDCD